MWNSALKKLCSKKLHVCGDENTEVQCCYLSINIVNVAMDRENGEMRAINRDDGR